MIAFKCSSQTDTNKVLIRSDYAKKAIMDLRRYDLCKQELEAIYNINAQLELDTQSNRIIIDLMKDNQSATDQSLNFYKEQNSSLDKELKKTGRKLKRSKNALKIGTTLMIATFTMFSILFK